MQPIPTMLGSCARAATAAEARYRIDEMIPSPRSVRVLALDERAAALVTHVADQHWDGARFFRLAAPALGSAQVVASLTGGVATGGTAGNGNSSGHDQLWWAIGGGPVAPDDVIDGADAVVMIATEDAGAAAAVALGDECDARGVTTVGLVLAGASAVEATVAAMRPYSRMLMVTRDERDVPEILLALRA